MVVSASPRKPIVPTDSRSSKLTLHFYPLGGFETTINWLRAIEAGRITLTAEVLFYFYKCETVS